MQLLQVVLGKPGEYLYLRTLRQMREKVAFSILNVKFFRKLTKEPANRGIILLSLMKKRKLIS
jgi:hypothetical protein